MKRGTIDEEIIEKIDEILVWENRPLSIKEVTRLLEENYDIKKSPQFVLKYLKELKKRKGAREKKNG